MPGDKPGTKLMCGHCGGQRQPGEIEANQGICSTCESIRLLVRDYETYEGDEAYRHAYGPRARTQARKGGRR